MTLETKVDVSVTATLVLIDEDGKVLREVTEADLREMGWRHRDTIYKRYMEQLHRAGINPDEGAGSTLRYFLEYASSYYDDFDMDEADYVAVRRLVQLKDDESDEE